MITGTYEKMWNGYKVHVSTKNVQVYLHWLVPGPTDYRHI